MQRAFPFVLGLVLLVAAAHATSKPNILLLMADQMRFDLLEAGGGNPASTPNLNKLVADGVWFKHGYSATPTCTPARAALLTGLNPWNNGMLGYGDIAPVYSFSMPHALDRAGYHTISYGKDHMGWNQSSNTGISHGYEEMALYDGLGNGMPPSDGGQGEFDNYDQWFQQQRPGQSPLATGLDWNTWHGKAYVYPEELHPTAWVGRKAVQFLNSARATRDEPWFLKVSFHRPHSPYDPPARLLNATTADMLPPVRVCAANATGAWDARFRGTAADPPGCGPTDDAWCGLMPAAEATLGRRAYVASARFVDEWVGEVMGALRATGLADNTFVMLVSDHGDGQGTHYHWRKGYPYEFSAHVPFALRWPPSYKAAVPRGSTVDDPVVELRDVFATALDIANGSVPSNVRPLDGKSLLCLLQDPSGAACNWRPYLELEHSTCYNETNHWNALTDGSMKYVYQAFSGGEQLFNLTADPWELVDVATQDSMAQELAKWRSRLVQYFQAQHRGAGWVLPNGTLTRRTQGQTYSPNYPRAVPFVGAPLMLGPPAGDNTSQVWTLNTTLAARGCNATTPCSLCLSAEPQLCAAVDGSTLQLVNAGVTAPAAFTLQAAVNRGAAQATNRFRIETSGRCVAATAANAGVALEPCSDQVWVVGRSGRLWDGNNLLCTAVQYPGAPHLTVLPPPLVHMPSP